MKLEHLIQSYNFNKINVTIKEQYENSGVIDFNNNVYASYKIEKDVVSLIQIVSNCITKEKTVLAQLNHSLELLKVINKTIELLCNINEIELKEILSTLGMFDGTYEKGKQIKHLDYIYKVEIVDGIIMFTIFEVSEQYPPLKSRS